MDSDSVLTKSFEMVEAGIGPSLVASFCLIGVIGRSRIDQTIIDEGSVAGAGQCHGNDPVHRPVWPNCADHQYPFRADRAVHLHDHLLCRLPVRPEPDGSRGAVRDRLPRHHDAALRLVAPGLPDRVCSCQPGRELLQQRQPDCRHPLSPGVRGRHGLYRQPDCAYAACNHSYICDYWAETGQKHPGRRGCRVRLKAISAHFSAICDRLCCLRII